MKLTKIDMIEIYNKVIYIFSDIRTMKAEIIRCIATIFHDDIDMTSGGTESILMACETYRDLAISKGIIKPEM
ncbi:unnamed protein product [Rotaria sordida]|uniref:Uncharacterized protein n=1 Tax=Rotaria sordida TaxID=392033 RepID=A0A814Z4Q1_9BILA|nr:unnamed protein product [Rotaria sordida]CAF3917396.1 unnamed protein product [Rotaria sordida]